MTSSSPSQGSTAPDFLTYTSRNLAQAVHCTPDRSIHGLEGRWRRLSPSNHDFRPPVGKNVGHVYKGYCHSLHTNPLFRVELEATGSRWLYNQYETPGYEWWQDPVFWGCQCRGPGLNVLGKILMDIRWNEFGFVPDEIPW